MRAKEISFITRAAVLNKDVDSSCIAEIELEMTMMGDSEMNQKLLEVVQERKMRTLQRHHSGIEIGFRSHRYSSSKSPGLSD